MILIKIGASYYHNNHNMSIYLLKNKSKIQQQQYKIKLMIKRIIKLMI